MSKLFIVDDDASIREMLTRFLARQGYATEAFARPQDLLGSIDEVGPDLVISDVDMPGMSGIDLASDLRRKGYEVPVILVTGRPDAAIRQMARRVGVIRIFPKPIRDLRALAAEVRETLQRSATSRESRNGNGNGRPSVEGVLRGAGAGNGTFAGTAPERLGDLRRVFLAGLSHELRTPLAAIKLALDGLFPRAIDEAEPERQRLVGIGRRNLDRIIDVVERQLGMLQLTVGDVTLARRLVNMRALLETLNVHVSANSPMLAPAFVDPERLRLVVQGLREGVTRGGRVTARFDTRGGCCLEAVSGASLESGAEVRCPGDAWAHDENAFTIEGCRQLVGAMDGTIRIAQASQGRQRIVVELPLVPRFVEQFDLEMPLRSFHKAATLSDRPATILRCELDPSTAPAVRQGVLERCLPELEEGELLVRGGEMVYLVGLMARDHASVCDLIDRVRGNGASVEPGLRFEIACRLDPRESEKELLSHLTPAWSGLLS